MKIITKQEFIKNKESYLNKIKNGSVFVYPTDTIYGIGCIATGKNYVDKVRKAKQMPKKPISIIAPSKQWVKDNCYIDKKAEKWLKKLPGRYTLILKLKNKNSIAKNVSFSSTIGIRIPKNWFYNEIKQLNIPILTTSVNITGQKPIESIKEISKEMSKLIDFAIDNGKLAKKPSTIIGLAGEKEIIIRQ